ncbi:hypothetical protein [Luteipulveratus mongoliensis]|uniref:hypothetical protein n=1 Tax=Luteipulveratus mongoliensis TaxID=571913 RepID=UPI000695E05C|nr:hypothetical protein [Luteipulveratus mongoliensis]
MPLFAACVPFAGGSSIGAADSAGQLSTQSATATSSQHIKPNPRQYPKSTPTIRSTTHKPGTGHHRPSRHRSSTATATSPAPSSSSSAPSPTATATSKPAPGGWPGESNTGVPAGTSLSAYSGPLTITTPGTTIVGKLVKGDLEIKAKNVTIVRSQVEGGIMTVDGSGASVTLTDSEVHVGPREVKAVQGNNFTITRTELSGGNSGGLCSTCTVTDSWMHGQEIPSNQPWHASGFRADQYTTLRHNTIACDARDTSVGGGCSAGLTMYGDWQPVAHVTIDNNLFVATVDGSFCTYGGSSGGKPYSGGANNIVFTNNVFQRGANGDCGKYGPVGDFDPKAPGNVWSGNHWDDGSVFN